MTAPGSSTNCGRPHCTIAWVKNVSYFHKHYKQTSNFHQFLPPSPLHPIPQNLRGRNIWDRNINQLSLYPSCCNKYIFWIREEASSIQLTHGAVEVNSRDAFRGSSSIKCPQKEFHVSGHTTIKLLTLELFLLHKRCLTGCASPAFPATAPPFQICCNTSSLLNFIYCRPKDMRTG